MQHAGIPGMKTMTPFMALARDITATGLNCHQVDVIIHEGHFLSFGTFRQGRYLQVSRSSDGTNWHDTRVIDFPDPAIRYVNVQCLNGTFHVYYVIEDKGFWSIRLATCTDILGPYRLHGTVLKPSTFDDYYCVGSCCSLNLGDRILLWYTGFDQDRTYNIQAAESHDGVTWKKTGTAYRYVHGDSRGCSKPSVILEQGRFTLFFSKTNPNGMGYWAIGCCGSEDGYTFSDAALATFNVSAQPYLAKYPCALQAGGRTYLWANGADTFPPTVSRCTVSRVDSLFPGKETQIITSDTTMPLAGDDEICLALDRTEAEVTACFRETKVVFCNGHVMIHKQDAVISQSLFMPGGPVSIRTRRKADVLSIELHDPLTGTAFSWDDAPAAGMSVRVADNAYAKRRPNVVHPSGQ